MRRWTLIDGDSEPTGEGLVFAQNTSLKIDGEINRRYGLAYAASLSPKIMGQSFFPGLGYMAIVFTSTGTIETVSL